MKVTIDSAGRLVIPKAIRLAAGLQPAAVLEVRYAHGHIEIEQAPTEVVLKKKGRFTVAFPKEGVPGLSRQAVEETVQRVRRDRISDL